MSWANLGTLGVLILFQRQILFTKPSPATEILSAIDFLVEQAAQGFPQEQEAGP